ncbi:MAG: hypothetical protein LBE62_00605 [Azonexus sp.]|jgi:hypothetical protein|nr:hypothetical protein [Azonexus sp.]
MTQLLLFTILSVLVLISLANLPKPRRNKLIWGGIILLGTIWVLFFWLDPSSGLGKTIAQWVMSWRRSGSVTPLFLLTMSFLLPGLILIALTLVLPKPWQNVPIWVGAILILICIFLGPDFFIPSQDGHRDGIAEAFYIFAIFWVTVTLVCLAVLSVVIRRAWDKKEQVDSASNGDANLASR